MANRDAPSGFKVVRHSAGGEHNRLSRYHIASALASNIFRGDAVIPLATSKNIDVAAAGNTIIGIFDGVMYIDSRGEVQISPYWATGTVLKTGTVADAGVYDDPNTLFEVQVDEDLVAADIGELADLIATHAGSAATGQSGQELDSSDINESAGQFKVVDLINRCDNAFGTHAKALVLPVLHAARAAVAA